MRSIRHVVIVYGDEKEGMGRRHGIWLLTNKIPNNPRYIFNARRESYSKVIHYKPHSTIQINDNAQRSISTVCFCITSWEQDVNVNVKDNVGRVGN